MTMPVVPAPAAAPAGPSAAIAQAPIVEKPRPSDTRAARAAALKEKLETQPAETETGEGATEMPAAAATTTAAETTQAGADDLVAKARADRLARIAEVRAKEAASEREREQRNAGKKRDGELEMLRKRIAELEPQVTKFKSPSELLAYAEKEGMSAEEVVKEIRARLSDPAIVAQRSAKTEADKIREELAAERKAREALEARLAERETQAQATAEGQHRAMGFLQQTEAKADSHPYVAAFLKRHGAQACINYANQIVAPMLPEEYSLDQLHDHFEQLLDELQLGAAGANAAPSALPANGVSQPSPKNGAGKPATTLSNALTAERATVTEEIPLARLPRSERTRRLKEKLDREP